MQAIGARKRTNAAMPNWSVRGGGGHISLALVSIQFVAERLLHSTLEPRGDFGGRARLREVRGQQELGTRVETTELPSAEGAKQMVMLC